MLVVGGGNTGFQIAKELAAARTRFASRSRARRRLQQRFSRPRPVLAADEDRSAQQDGRDHGWAASCDIGTRSSGRAPAELRQQAELGRVEAEGGGRPGVRSFASRMGVELEVDALLWATGYRPDYAWIEPPVVDPDGRVLHRRGVTDVPGLYFLGLTRQHTRGSAWLDG